MSSLSAFAESLSTGTVSVRNQPIPIRALRDSETAKLLVLFPEPRPPLDLRDMTKGSLAPLLPNENDPAYRAEKEAWYDLFLRVQIAVAAGFEGATAECETKDLVIIADGISRAFTRVEIIRIWNAYRALLTGDDPNASGTPS